VNPDGSFKYTPESDFIGEDHFVYRAADSSTGTTPGGTTPSGTNSGIIAGGSLAVVTIYVLPTDPLPKFILGHDQNTTDESGPQKVSDWATLITVGIDGKPSNLVITTDKPQLFAAPPTIDATGELAYTPAPNAQGAATITVTAEGGQTAGDSSTFTINVEKPYLLHNTALACDVDADETVAPNDALLIIDFLNAYGTKPANAPEGEAASSAYYDVTKDGFISPGDALEVINLLNSMPAASGEGEAAAAADLALLTLLAQDTAEATQGRRRL